MQTFIPFLFSLSTSADDKHALQEALERHFERIANALDYRRLGKQRVEAKQILTVLARIREQPSATTSKRIAWQHHPAVQQWEPYEAVLTLYYNCMIKAWVARGYNNSMVLRDVDRSKLCVPPFIINPHVVHRHRAMLRYKNRTFYKHMTSPVVIDNHDDTGYFWYRPRTHDYVLVLPNCRYTSVLNANVSSYTLRPLLTRPRTRKRKRASLAPHKSRTRVKTK